MVAVEEQAEMVGAVEIQAEILAAVVAVVVEAVHEINSNVKWLSVGSNR